MVVTMVVEAHDRSYKLYQYYKKKSEYSYRSAPLNDQDYEKEILLEEDEDGCDDRFDYEENRLPSLLTEEEMIKMKTPNKKKGDHTELSELKSIQSRNSPSTVDTTTVEKGLLDDKL